MASKLAAYEDRGSDDPYLSHDLEDVVALLANRPELADEVHSESDEVRTWIADHLLEALGTPESRPVLEAHLPELAQTPGLREALEDRIRRLVNR